MKRRRIGDQETVVEALHALYIASCLQCRHTAVRLNELTGKVECDWCRMTIQEARQRIFLGGELRK